jgi:hypothetical protein
MAWRHGGLVSSFRACRRLVSKFTIPVTDHCSEYWPVTVCTLSPRSRSRIRSIQATAPHRTFLVFTKRSLTPEKYQIGAIRSFTLTLQEADTMSYQSVNPFDNKPARSFEETTDKQHGKVAVRVVIDFAGV